MQLEWNKRNLQELDILFSSNYTKKTNLWNKFSRLYVKRVTFVIDPLFSFILPPDKMKEIPVKTKMNRKQHCSEIQTFPF